LSAPDAGPLQFSGPYELPSSHPNAAVGCADFERGPVRAECGLEFAAPASDVALYGDREVDVDAAVVAADGATVWTATNTIDGAQFAQGDVDVSVAIPVDTLTPGAYLLSLEARGTTQSVRFAVR